MPNKWSVEKLEAAARAFEEEAIRAAHTTSPSASFWKKLGMAASVRIGILEQQPSHGKALLRLYEFVQMHTFEPPALSKVMNGVSSYWSGRIHGTPDDVVALIRMTIATNVAEGINGYPGRKWLKHAVSLKNENPEVCVEMGICLRHSYIFWKPWTWLNRQKARRWFKAAISRDPKNARAHAGLALCTTETYERARLMLDCHRLDPEHVFSALYAKVAQKA